jgi:fibro-slime domain-containing protein
MGNGGRSLLHDNIERGISMKTTGKVRGSGFATALFVFLSVSLFFAGESNGQVYPETTWVRVILYDYHSSIGPYTTAAPDGANAMDTDFTFGPGQQCVASTPNNVVPGMVQDTLSSDRKLIPAVGIIPILGTYTYCTEPEGEPPCACHMVDWYRVSSTMDYNTNVGYDPNCVFACDSGQPNPLGGNLGGNPLRGTGVDPATPKNQIWYWVQASGASLPKWKGRTGEYFSPLYDSTNPYANVIVYDSLPFIHKPALGPAVYQFIANASSTAKPTDHFPYNNGGFFPLDGRGFGRNYGTDSIWDEPDYYAATATDKATNNHNFGYAMDMHTKVLYQKGIGLKFVFAGDDDLWCFINGKLVMDLGGVKAVATDSVFLDSIATLAGLVNGNYYNLDLFYNERNPTGADLEITTNIILVQPKGISVGVPQNGVLTTRAYDTMTAGDTIPLVGHVLDQDGDNVPTKSINIRWAEDTTKRPGDILLTLLGQPIPASYQDSTVEFTATQAFRTADIIASYADSNGSFACTTFVYVKPNVPVHMMLEKTFQYNPTIPNPCDTLIIPSDSTTGSVYAILRDQFQNFVGYDTIIKYGALDTMGNPSTAVISVSLGPTPNIGQVTASKNTFGKAKLYATDAHGFSDTCLVLSSPFLPQLISAVTRDYIGGEYDSSDGLIDEVDCYFNKSVNIGSADYVHFSVVKGSDTLRINSISLINDSSYALHIHDSLTNLSIPQTSWRPTVSVTNLPGTVDASVQAADGCAPVVWRVFEHTNGPNHKNDVVEVQFSENIFNRSGGQFTTANQPYQTLSAYILTASGYVLIDSMFNNILTFDSKQADSVLFFTMSNGANLTDTNYVNIRTPNPLIQDSSGNVPPPRNHRCRVTMTGTAISLIVFPNPSRGTFVRPTQSGRNGDIDLFDQPEAQQWVKNNNAGFVLYVQGVQWPQAGAGYVRANLAIYDAIGNLVNSAQTDNLLKNSQQGSSSSTNVSIYWNGANHRGMLVAPGVYRVILYIIYPANSLGYKNVRLVKMLGIK